MTNTFDSLYQRFKTTFIHNNGQAKFTTIERKIYDSSKIRELMNATIQQRTAPNHTDFGKTIQSIGYFIFAGADTSAMAELIAAKYWDDTVNSKYNLCSEHSLCLIAEGTLKRWSKFYTL